jgi:hypothetical protein
LEEICKQFLINLEESFLSSEWNGIPYNGYVCIDLFRDYYSDNFQVNTFKLFNIEEDLCQSYTEESITFENINYFNDYADPAQFMDFDIEESFDIPESNVKKILENKKESKFAVIKEPKNKKISIAKDFIFKFTKRENIDKKVLRKFRKFLKIVKKQNQLIEINKFWFSFINDNILPPMTYTNNAYNDNVAFKSFNTTYMLWLFSHPGGIELYEMFLIDNKNSIISAFNDSFISEEDRIALDSYLTHFAYIYSYQELKPGTDDQTNQTTIAVEENNSFDNCEHCQNDIYNMVFNTEFHSKYLLLI